MTEIVGLTIEGQDDKGRTYYNPVTATVRGVSQYNTNQYSFAGLPGYWEWQGDWALTKGTTYELKLSSKPKAGPNARPGSLYQDIRSAVATDSAPSVQPPQSQREGQETPPWDDEEGAKHLPGEYKDPVQIRIEKGMAFNAAYTLLAGIFSHPTIPNKVPIWENVPAELRQLRDRIYHEVILVPVAPRWCHKHHQPLQHSTSGKWGHLVDGEDPCIENNP